MLSQENTNHRQTGKMGEAVVMGKTTLESAYRRTLLFAAAAASKWHSHRDRKGEGVRQQGIEKIDIRGP